MAKKAQKLQLKSQHKTHVSSFLADKWALQPIAKWWLQPIAQTIGFSRFPEWWLQPISRMVATANFQNGGFSRLPKWWLQPISKMVASADYLNGDFSQLHNVGSAYHLSGDFSHISYKKTPSTACLESFAKVVKQQRKNNYQHALNPLLR